MTQANSTVRRLIVGLGVSGLATARYCLQKGWSFDLCDSRTELPNHDQLVSEYPESRLICGEFSAEVFNSYDQLIVSPGIALAEPAIAAATESGVEVVGDVELMARHLNDFGKNERPALVSITGSNGKSTVTSLLTHALCGAGLRAEMAGNIGVPVLDVLIQEELPEVLVVELSSFQLETTSSLKSDVAVLLNLSEDHMDRYEGMDDYLAAKQRIFKGAQQVVINLDDAASLPPESVDTHSDEWIGFSVKQGEGHTNARFALQDTGAGSFELIECDPGSGHTNQAWLNSDALNLKGLHNLANVLAVMALMRGLQVSLLRLDFSAAVESCKTYQGLDHRCQWIGKHSGVDFINDSKGTNVGSTLAALAGLAPQVKGRLWLLAGGDTKGQDLSPLQQACADYVDGLFVYGRDADRLSDVLAASVAVQQFETLDQAFAAAVENSKDGDLVLLSPAAASLDQFMNYIARGVHFQQLFGGLGA